MRRTLALVAEGEHRLMAIAASIPLDPAQRRRIGEQHQALMRPLVDALTNLGIDNAALSASLISLPAIDERPSLGHRGLARLNSSASATGGRAGFGRSRLLGEVPRTSSLIPA